MDANTKTSIYNNSSYAQWQADKLAAYNASDVGQAQAELSASSTSSTGYSYYTLPNGKVLARNNDSEYIDFKSLFSFLDEDDSSYSSEVTGIGNYQEISDNVMAAYEKMAKQKLGLS